MSRADAPSSAPLPATLDADGEFRPARPATAATVFDLAALGPYCGSRFRAWRRPSRAVTVGNIKIGGGAPIVVQSMTTTPTQDVAATVAQSIALAEAGCQIVRITAQNVEAARALKDIRRELNAAKIHVPLVADIHFLPKAALEAVEHVEKVRVNPGNYADKKKFAQRDYTDVEYQEELERLYEAFSPLVRRAKELGRAMRIGTNHGSLSDRIMNRYGDTPMGMVESALEFLRIAESHGYYNLVLSMKASNPKVMIEAYRLVVERMAGEGMHYPLHLGVTEAGDGDDARIKSAIGIGTLLADGLGDTIRVSLTEDPVAEIPVARALAAKAEALWAKTAGLPVPTPAERDPINPYAYTRRPTAALELTPGLAAGGSEPPRVIIPAGRPLAEWTQTVAEIGQTHLKLSEARVEGLLLRYGGAADAHHLAALAAALRPTRTWLVVEPAPDLPATGLDGFPLTAADRWLWVHHAPGEPGDVSATRGAWAWTLRHGGKFALDASAKSLARLAEVVADFQQRALVLTLSAPADGAHALGSYRALAAEAGRQQLRAPLWMRATTAHALWPQPGFGDQLLEASILGGGLLCDGVGDLLSVETVSGFTATVALTYNILQGARTRSTKTEYVACPSCGRTLFDLQSTTQRIRAATGHLKGVTIAVMGCIVNGPGEMADADFGYVGGAPGKINLYVGKTAVEFNIPQEQAVDRLVGLIRQHGKWVEPEAVGGHLATV